MSADGKPSSPFACLSTHKSDSIRFLQFPSDICTEARSVILAVWPLGIQAEGPYGDSFQYKLKGRPFSRLFGPEVVGGIRVMRDLLGFLYDRSWELQMPLLCSGHLGAKDSLLFRRRAIDAPPPAPLEWLVLGLLGNDRIRVIYDADDVKLSGIDTDQDHLGVLITALKKLLEGMDKLQRGEWSHDSFDFKLKGMPWHAHGVKTVEIRLMMLRIMEILDSFGWQSRTAIGQRSGTDDYRMPDTWYFVRPRGERGSGAAAGSSPPTSNPELTAGLDLV